MTRGCVRDSYQVYKADKLIDCWIQLWLLSDVEHGNSHSHVRLVSHFIQEKATITLHLFSKIYQETIWYHILFLKLKIVTMVLHCTVQPPRVTTSRKRPPTISNHLSKTPIFRSQSPIVETSHKRPQAVFELTAL